MNKLSRDFYNQDTITVAKALLGKHLVCRFDGLERIGKIVEVEAYLGAHDLACHASKGITKRTAVMYGPAGFAYVYLIYGMYHCFNIVTEPEGSGSAVLIRALEPLQNITAPTHGPGLLCNAMGINLSHNQHDLLSDTLFVADNLTPELTITETPRIGVHYAKEWRDSLLRFYIENNPYVSTIKKKRISNKT